jgi:N-acetylglutamate synthase-like GNAT family acetyltransferase
MIACFMNYVSGVLEWDTRPPETRANCRLITKKVTNHKQCQQIKETVQTWFADVKKHCTGWQFDWIADQVSDAREAYMIFLSKMNKNSLYVAYDASGKIQGVACAQKTSPQSSEILALATSPVNLAIFNSPLAIKGVGRALVGHIVRDSARKQCISVHSSISSEDFYRRLGFEGTTSQVLPRTKMEALYNNTWSKIGYDRISRRRF